MPRKKISKKKEEAFNAIHALVVAVINMMDTMDVVSKTFRPPSVLRFKGILLEKRKAITSPLEALQKISRLRKASTAGQAKVHLLEAATLLCKAVDKLILMPVASGDPATDVARIFHNFSIFGAVSERLYPVSALLPEVNNFFVTPQLRHNLSLLNKLSEAHHDHPDTGLFHLHQKEGQHGRASVYVPEYYDKSQSWPLIMALHPGGAYGRDFIWAWLREARSFGAILVVPTSSRNTWSLAGGGADQENIKRTLNDIHARWRIDDSKRLLTGTGDGGTYCYITGLDIRSIFTHLAPFSANFNTKLVEIASKRRLKDLPVYLTHGAMDWLLPLSIARAARVALAVAQAQVVWRKLDDAGHSHPRNVNADVMQWFLSEKNK